MAKRKFKSGDVVVLNSGSPYMSISKIVTDNSVESAECTYCSLGCLERYTLPINCLMLVNKKHMKQVLPTLIKSY